MNRRGFLAGAAGLAAASPLASARGAPLSELTVTAAIRGSINAGEYGVWPDALDDQSRAFRRMLEDAAGRGAPVFLPPGDYVISNIRLPRETRLAGVPGATRIVYGGDGYLFAAEDAAFVELSGLSFDGANRALGHAQALVEMRRVAHFLMDRCEIAGSAANGVALERVSGSVERCIITGAAGHALYSVEAERMRIAANTVADCGEGGILVHRWQAAGDGSIVSGNRIERIGGQDAPRSGRGIGIGVFRAGNVIVSDNYIADCGLSAIHASSAGNVQITGNQCLRSGGVALHSELASEGAVIASNIVDGAATGIAIANLDQGGRMVVCSGNVVRNLVDDAPDAGSGPGFGIGISVEADTAVTGNVVEGAPRHGMLLGWGPALRNVAATGNVIRHAREGFAVSVVEGAGTAIICDNIVDGAERAVVGYRWADAVTGDLASEGAGAWRHLKVERNLVS